MNECIRMGITELKIVIWGWKLSVLWSKIAFYSSAHAPHKTDNLPPQMTILSSYSFIDNIHEYEYGIFQQVTTCTGIFII